MLASVLTVTVNILEHLGTKVRNWATHVSPFAYCSSLYFKIAYNALVDASR